MGITIEADIKNGMIVGPNAAKLPRRARVLITLIGESPGKRPVIGTKTSEAVKFTKDAFAPLSNIFIFHPQDFSPKCSPATD